MQSFPNLMDSETFKKKHHRVSPDKCSEEHILENNILMHPNLFQIKLYCNSSQCENFRVREN